MIDDRVFDGSNVLITGGAGLIGSNLARKLVAVGANVTIVDGLLPLQGGNLFNIEDISSKVVLNFADVRDAYAITHLVKGKDYLFNLAAQTSHVDSMTDPAADLDINAAAQLLILEACRKHNTGIKIVFASTRQLYGRPTYLPVDETHPVNPVDVNGISKLAGEWYHLLYNNVYGLRACILRLTNTYGPGMRVKDARQIFLGVWVRNAIEGIPFRVFGDGSQLRDFNYVDDVVQALIWAAVSTRSNGQVFNLGSREVVSLVELAEMIKELLPGTRFDLVPFPKERLSIDIGDYYGNFQKIEQTLGWSPKVGLREGLAATLAYYGEHRERYWD